MWANILVIFRKKKSNLEVVLLIACFISTYLTTQKYLLYIITYIL